MYQWICRHSSESTIVRECWLSTTMRLPVNSDRTNSTFRANALIDTLTSQMLTYLRNPAHHGGALATECIATAKGFQFIWWSTDIRWEPQFSTKLGAVSGLASERHSYSGAFLSHSTQSELYLELQMGREALGREQDYQVGLGQVVVVLFPITQVMCSGPACPPSCHDMLSGKGH